MNQGTNNSGCRNWCVACTTTSVRLQYFHVSCACQSSFILNLCRKWCCVLNQAFITIQDELHKYKNSWLKEKSSRYWMPLTTLTINAQGNHCVRHSKGSYQSREISHTDIHSHARTHVRYCMHCFWKFWSHNTSIFSSTSCNWQPCLAPHGIIQGHPLNFNTFDSIYVVTFLVSCKILRILWGSWVNILCILCHLHSFRLSSWLVTKLNQSHEHGQTKSPDENVEDSCYVAQTEGTGLLL